MSNKSKTLTESIRQLFHDSNRVINFMFNWFLGIGEPFLYKENEKLNLKFKIIDKRHFMLSRTGIVWSKSKNCLATLSLIFL